MLKLRSLPSKLVLPVWALGHQCHPRWLHDPKRCWARWEGDTSPAHEACRQEGYKRQENKHQEIRQREPNSYELKQRQLRHHELKNDHRFKTQNPRHQEREYRELSLFEELFPEEATRHLHADKNNKEQNIPRLLMPDLDQVDEEDSHTSGKGRPSGLTKSASMAAFRQWNLAILVLQRASKSLNDSDFRRIAPKGKHIDDWKGPGDPLKGETY